MALSIFLALAISALEAPLPPVMAWQGSSENLIVAKNDPWTTPSEQTNFKETPNYAATRAWLTKLDAASPLLTIERFGTSAEGRELYYVRASSGGKNKPVLLVQAGIHAGEIDGKDAGLMLLRDIALRGKSNLLDKIDLIFVPIFNVDGHERASQFSRPNQRGPKIQGWRTTAQNLNLNRDYLKADTPEMKAMIGLIGKLNPALYLDLHVTDGIDYQYDITYAFPGWDGLYAQSPNNGVWLDKVFRPSVDAALKKAGHIPGHYVDAVDNRAPDKGIMNNADSARFSTGYADLRHVPAVLLETHSLKPYRQRVLGTYVFVEAALKLLAAERDSAAQAKLKDMTARPNTQVLSWKPLDKPIYEVDFLGIAHEDYVSPISGRQEVKWLGKPVTQKMPVYGEAPHFVTTVPVAWWVPITETQVITKLKLHGIKYEVQSAPRTIILDMIRLSDPKINKIDEGHVPLKATFTHEIRTQNYAAGAVRVPSDQPLGLLAAAMLEAESGESLLAWNYFPHILQRTEYIEGYAIEPLAQKMLSADLALRAEFEAKLKADPEFAKDADARLGWFYARSAYYDDRYLLYPVGREVRNDTK
jgi:hypothetical protein